VQYNAYLNEPNGVWAHFDSVSNKFVGLYIADTGNNCIRYANEDGQVTTLDLTGIPDVRTTIKASLTAQGQEEECKDCMFDPNDFA